MINWNWVGMYVIGRSLVKKRDRWAIERESDFEDLDPVNHEEDNIEEETDPSKIKYLGE